MNDAVITTATVRVFAATHACMQRDIQHARNKLATKVSHLGRRTATKVSHLGRRTATKVSHLGRRTAHSSPHALARAEPCTCTLPTACLSRAHLNILSCCGLLVMNGYKELCLSRECSSFGFMFPALHEFAQTH
jgi:hypothetical protein